MHQDVWNTHSIHMQVTQILVEWYLFICLICYLFQVWISDKLMKRRRYANLTNGVQWDHQDSEQPVKPESPQLLF